MSATPIQVRNAFLPQPALVAGIKLRPVTAAHWLYLEELDSPFTSRTRGRKAAFLELLVTVHVLTLDPAQLIEAPDPAAIQRDARALAARIPVVEFRGIARAVANHIAASFATRPASDEGDDATRPFRTSNPRKAAAGSSIPSPASARGTVGRSTTP